MGAYHSLICMVRVLQLAWRTPLQEGDLPSLLPAVLQARELAIERVLAAWEQQRQQKRPSLETMMVELYRREVVSGITTALLFGVLNGFARPLFLKLLIDNCADRLQGMMWAGFVCATLLVEAQVYIVNKYEIGDRFSCALVVSLAILVQRKGMRLAPGTSGDLNERVLMAADVMPTFENWKMLYQIFGALFSLVSGLVLLIVAIGWIGLLGGFAICAAIALNRWLSTKSRPLEVARLNHASRRLSITTRALDSIRAVKFCAWEDRYLNDIISTRVVECTAMQRFRLYQFTGAQIGRVTPIFAASFTYTVVVAVGWDLDAGMAYAALSTFQSMRLALIVIPMCVSFLIALRTSFERINGFLALPEFDEVMGFEDDQLAVNMENISFRWPIDGISAGNITATPALAVEKLRLHLPWSTLTAIVGGVGCGKTALITAVLGDLHCDAGGIFQTDLRSVGVVTQKAFVVNATLQENVIFGRPWDETLFNAVAWAAALDVDLKQLPGGQLTEIGERGVTLSGGQQQRLSIARALYGRPRLLVLDDPFAAVDGRVAGQIFTRAIKGIGEEGAPAGVQHVRPEGRAVLMSLNQFRFLSQFDQVLFMEKGRVVEEGPPHELLGRKGARFASFVGGNIGDCEGGVTDPTALDGEEPPLPNKLKGQLVQKEHRASGKVKREVYMQYLRGMGWWRVAICLINGILSYGAFTACDQWLAFWLETREGEGGKNDVLYVIIYCICALSFVCLEIMRGFWTGRACVATSKHVHDRCISHLLHAPMSYFEETPSGRLISRFGADMGLVDGLLAMLTEGLFSLVFNMVILLAVICITAPLMLIVVAIAVLIYIFAIFLQDVANQDAKRISNNALSPVLTCLGEMSEDHGKLVIRSMNFTSLYCDRFDALIDDLSTSLFVSQGLLGSIVYLAYSLAFVIAVASSFIILNVGSPSPSRLGLALTYAFLLPYFMQMVAQAFTMFTVCITSLERLLQSAGDAVPQEPPRTQPHDAKLMDMKWPASGTVAFENVSLIYRPDLPSALNSCSFKIKGGSKVGVVGRSGAGKSSLFVVLFRLVEPSKGHVTIDGIVTGGLGLGTLRRAMATIPQEPLLFEGSVRSNVDPLNDHSDEDVAKALLAVNLAGREMDLPRQLSAGEKQLLQMARTILRQVKVVVMDEPTSNIDPQTDEMVQRVVREAFASCTVLTIAHRLDTVIDADQMLVMDAGSVAESGPPATLLQHQGGRLTAMVDGQGPTRAAELRRKAAMGWQAFQTEQSSASL